MEEIFSFDHPADGIYGCLAINTKAGLLAAEDSLKQSIDIWQVDFDSLIKSVSVAGRTYSNVKVVILGERGSGKSNLASALSGKGFSEGVREHTAEVHRWTLEDVVTEDGKSHSREIAFWDLPNHDQYGIIQRLHLLNTGATLLTLDSGLSTSRPHKCQDGLSQLRQQLDAVSAVGNSLLVATKSDLAELIGESAGLATLQQCLQGQPLFITSAKTGSGIDQLRHAILASIDWSKFTVCEPAEILWELQEFVNLEKKRGTILISALSLYDLFTASNPHLRSPELFRSFSIALKLIQNLGLVYGFSLGDQVLLDPAYIHTYAAALVEAAGRDRHGMGRVPTIEAESGEGPQFQLVKEKRIPYPRQESLLLRAMIEELRKGQLIYEVSTHEQSYLVFPCQPTRKFDQTPPEHGRAARGSFQGRAPDIYSSLVVRLLGLQTLFSGPELYRNAATFSAASGGKCGLLLDLPEGEDRGSIDVFFDKDAEAFTKQLFLKFVEDHIGDRARPGTFKWDARQSEQRLLSGRSESEAARINVFFSYEAVDSPNVVQVAQELRNRGVNPWLESERLVGGDPSDRRQQARAEHRIAVVVVGRRTLSTMQRDDCADFKARGCRIIPIILPGSPAHFEMPDSLRDNTPVDFRILGQQPYDRLVEGIKAATVRKGTKLSQPPRNRHVFLSYCHDDGEKVEALRHDLISKGFSVWSDNEILGGQDWKLSIYEAIQSAYAIVACFSENSADRKQLGMYPEIAEAIEQFRKLPPGSIYLIPVRLSECKIPPIQVDAVRWLHHLQVIDLFPHDRPAQFARLVEALKVAHDRAA